MGGWLDVREAWDFSNPAESERRFRSLLEEAEERNDREASLEIQTQIARALGLQRDFAGAHSVLDDVAAALDEDTPNARLRYLLERGRVLNSAGEPDEARPYFAEAWELGTELPNPGLAVDAAHMMAIAAPRGADNDWNERAVRYAEECGDPEALAWLGSLYNNMGWDAHDAGDYATALALHERCLQWHRERDTGRGERIARWSVAKQLRFLGRREEALQMQRTLLADYELDEPGGEGFVHEELAELLDAAGDREAARPHFAAAHEMLSELGWIDQERLARLQELASG